MGTTESESILQLQLGDLLACKLARGIKLANVLDEEGIPLLSSSHSERCFSDHASNRLLNTRLLYAVYVRGGDGLWS